MLKIYSNNKKICALATEAPKAAEFFRRCYIRVDVDLENITAERRAGHLSFPLSGMLCILMRLRVEDILE